MSFTAHLPFHISSWQASSTTEFSLKPRKRPSLSKRFRSLKGNKLHQIDKSRRYVEAMLGYDEKLFKQLIKGGVIKEGNPKILAAMFYAPVIMYMGIWDREPERAKECEKFDIPYRTMTEWELGHRNAPPYVLRLLSYYVSMQKMLNEK